MTGRGRGRGFPRTVPGSAPDSPTTPGLGNLTIKGDRDDGVWDEYKDHVAPSSQPQGVGRSNNDGSPVTWDMFMYKEEGVNPVGDKIFQAFLNRQNVFGTCRHRETLASGGRCGCVKRTPLNLCLECTSILPCCYQSRSAATPAPSSSRH